MTRIIEALSDISHAYDALFVDLWGCVHNGVKALPEAVAALQTYRATGGKVVLVTNSPRPMAGVIAQLDALGVDRAAFDSIAPTKPTGQPMMAAGRGQSESSSMFNR